MGTRMILTLPFTGHFEKDDKYVYAVCDSPSLAAHGRDQDEAMKSMLDALAVYVETLIERDELEDACKAGILAPKFEVDTPTESYGSSHFLQVRRDEMGFHAPLVAIG